MDCEVCGDKFKIVQRREDEKDNMVRYVYWCSCEGCGAGLVYYHPYVPKTDYAHFLSFYLETYTDGDDKSSKERRSE